MFLRWWKKHTNIDLIGLEINSTAIKLLEIKTIETSYSIENFAVIPLPAGAVTKDQISNPAIIATLLKDTFKTNGIQTKNIALAIPRSSVIIKNISIDKRLNASEMEARAWVEANRHFPDLIGDIYLDFTIIGPSSEDPALVDLILVACRKEQINPYIDLLQLSGLIPKVIDVNCYALDRTLSVILKENKSTNAIAMLNLNLTLSSLIVSHASNLIYAHDHSYDGNRLLAQVKKFKEENENIDFSQNGPYKELLNENLSSHLRHTMHFFYSSRTNINIGKIYISGECATIPNIAEFIRQEVNIETEIANPFLHMSPNEKINKTELQQYAPTLALCCGLALSL